jgi:SAM-dependent methyltransferase
MEDAHQAELHEHYTRGEERGRLAEGHGRLEFARTTEIILRRLPTAPALVADIGGGPGRYALWLAGLGYRVEHRDLVPLHVRQLAQDADGIAGLRTAVGDARDLDLADAFADRRVVGQHRVVEGAAADLVADDRRDGAVAVDGDHGRLGQRAAARFLGGQDRHRCALSAMVIPTFLLALLLLALSTYLARSGNLWLQPGYMPFSQSPGQWLGRMILPWIAVAATQAAVTAKLTRTAVLDVLGEDYIRTARAKGLSERDIFWHHVSRPASIPVIASVGVGFGVLLGSAAIVDQVFALGGIGQALLTAVKQGDLMVVMGTVLVTVIVIALVNLIADIGQALVDPQVHIT